MPHLSLIHMKSSTPNGSRRLFSVRRRAGSFFQQVPAHRLFISSLSKSACGDAFPNHRWVVEFRLFNRVFRPRWRIGFLDASSFSTPYDEEESLGFLLWHYSPETFPMFPASPLPPCADVLRRQKRHLLDTYHWKVL